jgi:hypothetical protein
MPGQEPTPVETAPTADELSVALKKLTALLEENYFRQRGNSTLRIALAAVLIFVTTLLTSSSVSYCITASQPAGWCAAVPGVSARDARVQDERRFTDLERRLTQLEDRQ